MANLGYKSKCWVGFNFQFDILVSHIGADERGFKEGGSWHWPCYTKSLNYAKFAVRPKEER
jgi:hypothetical protein